MIANKVIVFSAASGAGHIRAADALVSAFVAKGIEAEQIEVLKYTNGVFRRVYSVKGLARPHAARDIAAIILDGKV